MDRGMRWHSFLMVFMIIGGVLTIISGLTTIVGAQYAATDYTAEWYYKVYPGLRTTDLVSGILWIGLGGFQIVVRCLLHAYKRSGITAMWVLYIASLLVSIFYLASASSATGISFFNSQTAGQLISTIVMMIINGTYYGKRADLFE